MRKYIIFLLLAIIVSSCALLSKNNLEDEILFTISGDPTLADEFLYIYEKNNFNNDSIYTEEDVDEYFELFINFKLKVEAAKSAGIDTTTAFLSEYETYKDQLIQPYLTASKKQEKLVKQAYERMKYEVDASHILVTLKPDAQPEDTIKAYQKILELYEKAMSGEDFGDLATNYSEDPSAKSNKGRLGYFTAFQMVYPFEEAAYNTPIDSISDIIRSRFGYHILKVHDKRPYSGKVKVSHIMLRVDPTRDTTAIRNKIFEIHDQLGGGADWDQLCERYSQDQRTKNSGGTLPFIGLRQINDAAFEEVAFNLQNPGDVSDPVRSHFGWHIIKLEEKQGLQPFDDLKEKLEQRVSKDDRSRLSKQAVVSELKTANRFKEFLPIRGQVVLLADSTLLLGTWDVAAEIALMNDSIFSIDGKFYLVGPLIDEIKRTQEKRTGIDSLSYMNELIDDYIEKCLYEYEEKLLIQNNREVSMLLSEYYEGILLFEIMNQKVWGKAVEDTLGLREYFTQHQKDYYWSKRANAVIFTSSNKDVMDKIKSDILADTYTLMEVILDPEQDLDVLKNNTLDSMLNLYAEYDSSTITIYTNDKSSNSTFYSDLMSYLKQLGLPKTSIMESKSQSPENKIRLVLNSTSKKSLEYQYNKESALTLQVLEGLFEKGDNQLIDSVHWKKGIYDISGEHEYQLIVINDILDVQPKKLKDVKGLVISDYQNYLERNWLNELKKEYAIEVNKLTLDKIKKAYRKRLSSTG